MILFLRNSDELGHVSIDKKLLKVGSEGFGGSYPRSQS